MWQLDPSCQDGRPERACGTTASTPSPPPLLPPPQAPPRAKSPAKSQQGSTRSGPSAKSKMSPSSTAKSADEIQTEPTGRPGESVIKLAVNVPREPKKKPIMACLFCRERKIACGHPAPTDEDRRCKYVTSSAILTKANAHPLILFLFSIVVNVADAI
ncbi:hypothetical protein BDY19DRAFT_110595 [Irpex rosettiformis]|uniref:Uncharacterized protein n=1 Tax=Irpex rosettiformis TaxID=378272 RepID=A0ACB8U5M4_9APHY|nr:hypothetical protein BDY19DRAFT_110595 [Irpex rosettiformis]